MRDAEKTSDELWEEENGPSLGLDELIADAKVRSEATDSGSAPVEHDPPDLEKER